MQGRENEQQSGERENEQQSEKRENEQQSGERESEQQGQSGMRFIYNMAPSSRESASAMSMPFAFHYTPLGAQNNPDTFLMQDKDCLKCLKCRSFINQHCQIFREKKMWLCCICQQNNPMPPSFRIPDSLLQSDIYDTTVSTHTHTHTHTHIHTHTQHYIFLIDLCLSDKELEKVKQMVIEFIESKAEEEAEGMEINTSITLITFSKYVYVYDWSCNFDSVVCFGGGKQIQSSELAAMLGVEEENTRDFMRKYGIRVKGQAERIVRRVAKMKALGDVVSPGDHVHRRRADRAYGQALDITFSLCDLIKHNIRVISTLGGPCTFGVGKIIDTNFNKTMRSIAEYETEQNCEYKIPAVQFYTKLRERILGCTITLDLFIFSLEETGLTEMKDLIAIKGGLLVLGQTFSNQQSIFESSFRKAYLMLDEQNYMAQSLASCAFLEVACSKDVAINGLLGCGYALAPVSQKVGWTSISEHKVGYGGTNCWYLGGLDSTRSVTVVYELNAPKAFDNAYFIQVKTSFTDYWGRKKTRVMTVKKLWAIERQSIMNNFDQEAAVILMARLYLFKLENEYRRNLRVWLDKALIKWAAAFASYRKGSEESFSLPDRMKFLPQFVYYFRRTPLFRRTGISLDELTYQAHIFNRQTVSNCITIIEPALLSYCIDHPAPSPVRLEQEEMKGQSILLLDTYFNVVLWYGEHVGYWQDQQFHKKKEYEHVKTLLEAPEEDIKFLLNDRFPHPGFYRTSPGHSKERFLKSRVSPLKDGAMQNQNILTDETSIEEFTKALVHVIVHEKISP